MIRVSQDKLKNTAKSKWDAGTGYNDGTSKWDIKSFYKNRTNITKEKFNILSEILILQRIQISLLKIKKVLFKNIVIIL